MRDVNLVKKARERERDSYEITRKIHRQVNLYIYIFI